MKNLIPIFILLFLITSCRKPGVEPITIHDRFIENKSSHKIKIKNVYFYDIELNIDESFNDRLEAENGIAPINSGYYISETDSIEVIYDDTLTVFHGSKNYTMLRDLRRYEMFDFVESETNGAKHYIYTYTFTDADYDEAKTK